MRKLKRNEWDVALKVLGLEHIDGIKHIWAMTVPEKYTPNLEMYYTEHIDGTFSTNIGIASWSYPDSKAIRRLIRDYIGWTDDLIEEALNEACSSIQKATGQTTADIASAYFTDFRVAKFRVLMYEYVNAELEHADPLKHSFTPFMGAEEYEWLYASNGVVSMMQDLEGCTISFDTKANATKAYEELIATEIPDYYGAAELGEDFIYIKNKED